MSNSENTAEVLEETLILVDADDNAVGTCEKVDCHLGDGRLHRAFSVFLFNPAGELLIQQRSEQKMLWPMIWANSCCSHPRSGEDTRAAALRRIREELGVSTELKFLYKFVYQARYADVGSEYENCWVFFGNFDGALNIDANEIADYRFVVPEKLTAEIDANPDIYSPWLKLEWAHIREHFAHELP
jgi:isopentenyl-diphosphate delta-isomerase